MKYFIKCTEALWLDLQRALWAQPDVETAAALFVKKIATHDGVALVVKGMRFLEDVEYRDRRRDFLELSPSWINGCCRQARSKGLGVLTVHTHLHSGPPAFSWADDQGDARLLPAMQARVAEGAVGSIVISRDDAVARAFEDGHVVPARVTVVGARVATFPKATTRVSEDHARQVLALGPDGQAALGDLRVGIVGLGGTGSIVHMLLRHLGVRRVRAMEPDVLETSNRPRIVGTRVGDETGATTKVAIAQRLARDIQGAEADLQALAQPLTDEAGALKLASCDLVFSCVDRLLPRALLNTLAYTANVPIVDMGSAFRVDATGRIVSQGGKVAIVGPGRTCLWCWGDLDPDRIRAETLPPGERRNLAAEGYIEGADAPQPAVIAFNAEIAAVAVVEAMRMVTGFAGTEAPPERLNFDFARGTVVRVRGRSRPGCAFCTSTANSNIGRVDAPSADDARPKVA